MRSRKGVSGDFGGAGDDSRRVSYGGDFYYEVGFGLGDGDGGGRVLDEVVGYYYDFVGVVGVCVGVAEGAAGGFAQGAADVAVFVDRGGADEGDVYVDVSRHYRAGTASVASEYDGDAHAAFRYELADGAVDGAHDFCHYSAFYVVDDFFVDSEEGGRE